MKTRASIIEKGGGIRGLISLLRILARNFIKFGPRLFIKELLWRLRDHQHDESSRKLIAALQQEYQSSVHVIQPERAPSHNNSVDIVICVHNAFEDVRRSLFSVIEFTTHPYRIVLIDDGSMAETADFLRDFAQTHGALLFRHESALGYTVAANCGLELTSGEFAVLLNSDTIVGPEWLDRMLCCAMSDSHIGLVGPLSNTASWQSVPFVEDEGDWATNSLPDGISVRDMVGWVAAFSAKLYPRMPFLNGFCLMIRRAVVSQIGLFDARSFPKGYGEENDYCIRAQAAGWTLALADDVYIYHAQSKSYSHERRKQLSQESGLKLERLHGRTLISAGVQYCRNDRVLEGIRARAKHLLSRVAIVETGKKQWAGKKVAFVLPIAGAGGGANIVLSEARAMRRMGVDACIVNLESCKPSFDQHYAGAQVPIHYLRSFDQLREFAEDYDAVIATAHHTVKLLLPLRGNKGKTLGYYVQDFEPLFYSPDEADYQTSLQSYTLIPEIIPFTKSQWNHAQVLTATGVNCHIVGPSYETDLFMPRSRPSAFSNPNRPIQIGAMIRPSSPRRGAGITMRVMKEIKNRFQENVDIVIFGTDSGAPEFASLERNFAYQNFGRISPETGACVLNDLDIFVDFSTYQAMGLTAMEAMACGCAVIVPQQGGATSFAVHDVNSLVIDTSTQQVCLDALLRLVLDQELCYRLQTNAISSITQFFPELPALKILDALFSQNGTSRAS